MVDFKAFPFRGSYIFLFIITLLGVFVSPLSITQTLPAAISKITPYLIVVLFFSHLKTKEDTEFVYKKVLWSFGVLCAYALVEFALQMNPVGEYLKAIIPEDLLRGKIYVASEFRFFSIRCSSLLAICIAWGAYCCLIVSCIFCIVSYSEKVKKQHLFIIIILLIFNVLISGSRTPMLYFVVIFFGYFWTTKLSVKLFLILIIGIFVVKNYEIIMSVLSSFSEDNTEVEGSSINMRLEQLNAVSSVIYDSPIWGLGIKGYAAAVNKNSDVLGAESIWLQQLINSGLLGILFQIMLYFSVFKYFLGREASLYRVQEVVLVVGWIVFCTLSTSPGLTEPYFLTIVLLTKRYIETHRNLCQFTN